jgi:hypothetical protein
MFQVVRILDYNRANGEPMGYTTTTVRTGKNSDAPATATTGGQADVGTSSAIESTPQPTTHRHVEKDGDARDGE